MDWGVRLEPAVRGWLGEQLGKTITPADDLMSRNPTYPFMVAHLDGVIRSDDSMPEGVEIKTCDKLAADEFGEVGTDEIPVRYVLQVTHYMVVTNIRRFHVGVLVGGNDARQYRVDYDPTLAEMLIEAERNFWTHVLARTPPDCTTLADTDYRWPTSSERSVRANDDILDDVANLNQWRREELRAARNADEIEVRIKSYMREASMLTDKQGHKLLTWRSQQREHFDSQTFAREHADLAAQYRTSSNYRVFRLK
jgi:predicted phage-related endonuclease